MDTITIAILTKTGVQGNGKDNIVNASESAGLEVSERIGKHNVKMNYDAKGESFLNFTVRGWQTQADVTLPTESQILSAEKAIASAVSRRETAIKDGIAADIAEVSKTFGAKIASLLYDNIVKANQLPYPYTFNYYDVWTTVTINDPQLDADIASILSGGVKKA